MNKDSLKRTGIVAVSFLLYHVLASMLPFDVYANRGIALLVCIAILWLTEALPVMVTALLVPVMGVLVGVPGSAVRDVATNELVADLASVQALSLEGALRRFASPIIFLFMGGFALAAALSVNRLDKKITQYVMNVCGDNVRNCVFGIFVLSTLLSMWISNTATAAMMLPLMLGLANVLPSDGHLHRSKVFMLLGLAYCCSVGGIGTMVGSPPNAIASAEIGYTFSDWMRVGLPVMLIMQPVVIGALYLMLRPHINVRFDRKENQAHIPWTSRRLTAMCIFVLVAALWMAGDSLKEATGIPFSDAWTAIAGIVLIVLLRVASWRDISEHTDWGVLLLFGGGLSLSSMMSDSGASFVLADQLRQLVQSSSPPLIILVVSTFIIFLTEFTSNTASAALLVPMFASVAQHMGMPPESLVLVIGIGASCAFMMPVATPPNALVYGTGEIEQRDMLRVGFVLNILSIAVVTLYVLYGVMQ